MSLAAIIRLFGQASAADDGVIYRAVTACMKVVFFGKLFENKKVDQCVEFLWQNWSVCGPKMAIC